MAKRLKRSVASVRRVVDDERAERLRVWAEVGAEQQSSGAAEQQMRGVAQRGGDAATRRGVRSGGVVGVSARVWRGRYRMF